MDTTGHADNEPGLRWRGTWVLLHAASLLVAADVHAQSNACDQLKGTLAARIEASGVRDYSLETVPASTPLQSGARVIGTCEAGRYKVLYRRGGGGSSVAAEPAEAARPAPAPAPRPPAPAPAPAVAARPVLRSNEAAIAPVPEPVNVVSPVPVASQPEPPPVAIHPVVQPVPQPEQDSAPTIPWTHRLSEFAAANWRWLAALALLPVAGWLWAWRAHRNAYDKYGLPRGPRL